IVFLILFLPTPAAAYVDPGSGAMMWQAIAATMIGAAFYVRRIGRWVRQRFRSDKGNPDPPAPRHHED
ncbi:MAG TPA: hypothetical protein VGF59_06755, partial [Bryobacteraceae bacterium]